VVFLRLFQKLFETSRGHVLGDEYDLQTQYMQTDQHEHHHTKRFLYDVIKQLLMISHPRSVLFDVGPVLVELHNVQVLQLDQIVKNGFDFFLRKKQDSIHV